MNLKQFGLHDLAKLWEASKENQSLRTAIELELQLHIFNNKNFSREFIFKVCKIGNHSIGISFIPTSESHKNYGSNITIDMLLDENEMKELLTNYHSNPSVYSYGQVKAKVLVKDNLSAEQIAKLATVGFNTSDILETMHV